MRHIEMPTIAFTAVTLGAGSLMLVSLSLLLVGFPNFNPGPNAIMALLWLGVFPTGFAYVMRYFLIKRIGVSSFALAMNTVPIFGVMIAAGLLGEPLEWRTLLALLLVLCGLAIARLGTQTKAREEV